MRIVNKQQLEAFKEKQKWDELWKSGNYFFSSFRPRQTGKSLYPNHIKLYNQLFPELKNENSSTQQIK